ncbi:MAG TPA: TetR/AcrR family transcriptional regulator [Actinomycetota bacterium]|nr:TetR/AcrR family transcriptional regulator [Actinomycetota bacterium]
MPADGSRRNLAEQSLALLWGWQKKPRRGPKPGLDVERIARAAIDIADTHGLEALSMRSVSERLGVGAMSLYTYVPGKAELLDVMVDRVVAEKSLPATDGGWRARLEAIAREDWALYRRHRWLLEVSFARSVMGPNVLQGFEGALAAISGTGFTASEMPRVVTLLGVYVRGAAKNAADAIDAAQQTGVSDDEWWLEREPILDKYIDFSRYPTLGEVAEAGGFTEMGGDADYFYQRALDDFEFGLERVLDGLEAYIERRTSRAGPGDGAPDG